VLVIIVIDGTRQVFNPDNVLVTNGDNLEFSAHTDNRRMQARIQHTHTDLSFGVYDLAPSDTRREAGQ